MKPSMMWGAPTNGETLAGELTFDPDQGVTAGITHILPTIKKRLLILGAGART
jgi:hypothetical protein